MAHLNKNQYLIGKFCPKKLYFDFHAKETPDAAAQQRMEEGRQVGEWARESFLDGVLMAERRHEEAVMQTRRLMADPGVSAIFEGAFEHGGLRVRPDILVRQGDAWDLIEVKSSTSVKEEHVEDVALTRHVVEASGVPIAACRLRFLNKDFRLGTPRASLFVDGDVTEKARFDPEETDDRVLKLLGVLEGPTPPEAPTGLHCRNCDHYGECIPERHVLSLPNLRERKYGDLCALNVERIADIPDRFSLTGTQARVRKAVVAGRPQVEPGLADALRQVCYPLLFLDFESMQTAFPLYPDTAPYEQIPTQYSLHVLSEPEGELSHREFLHESSTDPRRTLAEQLLSDLGEAGSIVVYHQFEKVRISGLARGFPDLAPALNALLPRLYDLCDVIKQHCYHPEFEGSFSLKQTLPALTQNLRYVDLNIQNGSAATAAYREMIAPETSPDRRQEIAQDLKAYCERDTLAMVRLYEALYKASNSELGKR